MKDEMLSAKSCIQLESCQASIEIIEQCRCAIELLEEMLEKGSSMLASDVGCGAILCQDYLPRAEAVARTVETRLYPRKEGAC